MAWRKFSTRKRGLNISYLPDNERQLYFRNNGRSRIARKFGLTLAEYNELIDKPCVICGLETKRMALDHCHRTGKMRAVLCLHCNVGLGAFKDNVGYLKRAIAYIEYFEKKHADAIDPGHDTE